MDTRLKELKEEDDFEIEEGVVEHRELNRRKSSAHWFEVDQRRQSQQQQVNRSSSGPQRPSRSVKAEKTYREESSDEDQELTFKIGPRVEAFVKKRQKYIKKVNQVSACLGFRLCSRAHSYSSRFDIL